MPRLLIALPVLLFGALLYIYAVNVPWYDDVEALVAFLPAYIQANTLGEQFDWLVKPNNEHRILFGKLLALGVTRLMGELNFKYIMLVGGACSLGTLAVLFRAFRGQKALPLLLFAPAAFLLLQPQYYLTCFWGIASTQYIGATFFVVFGLHMLSAPQSGWRFWAAVLLQTFAALSMSNGLFGWVAGAVMLLAQRRWGNLTLWLAATVFMFWFYFHDFASPQGNESSFPFFLKNPHLVVFGFFTFMGGLFDFFPNQPILWRSLLPTLAGIGITVATGLLLWKDWRRGYVSPATTPAAAAPSGLRFSAFRLGAYSYLLINALAIGFLRPRFGYEVMLLSNYMFYPALWVSLLYLHWISEQPNSGQRARSFRLGLGGAVLVWVVSYNLHWPLMHGRQQRQLALAFNQQHNGAGLGGLLNTPLGDYIDKQMKTVATQSLYHYPAIDPALPDSLLRRPAASFGPFLNRPVSIEKQPDRLLIELLPEPTLTAHQPAYLLLQSDTHTYLLYNQAPLRLVSYALNRPIVAVKAEALTGLFWPGQYRIGWVTLEGGKPLLRYTEQTVQM